MRSMPGWKRGRHTVLTVRVVGTNGTLDVRDHRAVGKSDGLDPYLLFWLDANGGTPRGSCGSFLHG